MKNTDIRTPKVRVVDEDGEQLGILPTDEAIKIAQEKSLDLVLVAPNANPPVARIMDFGKYKYEKEKREREAKKRSKQSQLKQMKFRLRIDTHDFMTKVNRIREFLSKGSKVRVVIMFRGREMAFSEQGAQLLEKVRLELEDIAEVDRAPKMEGRDMWMILKPKSPQGGKADG
ncbi:translation initiation factor IF-3 [Kosmotoga pacifica]|uniref:translation initiation factor IF-3 n=1 Tax=Kosmotoga pacifica TaxID=1330330 RepID=UPI002354EBBB|nr:translation initiation factor IF-3 [Kosmotoga pacifica]